MQPEIVWQKIIEGAPLIDVRAPVEFAAGSLPNAVNLPIMNNEERAAVGTAYKQEGRESAMKLGYSLVSGSVKSDRVLNWKNKIQQDANTILYCFRGGLRSQISQSWIHEAGVEVPIVDGGYKAVRQLIIKRSSELIQQTNLMILTGMTGSGKTRLIEEPKFRSLSLNLEKIARHRGSAFGIHEGATQPSQIDFENRVALEWERWKIENSNDAGNSANGVGSLLVEDESRLVGRCVLTDEMFSKLRASPVILIEESMEFRVEEIMRDYILNSSIGRKDLVLGAALFDRYIQSAKNIEKKLGGTRTKEVLQDLQLAKTKWQEEQDLAPNKVWIEKLLAWYYDPLYLGSRLKRNPVVLFKGNLLEVRAFLEENLPRKK